MMKAGITVLADTAVQNIAHKIAYELNQKYGVAFFAALYPAHISLKQPFNCEDLPRLEAYCDDLAARTAPFPILLDEFYHGVWNGNGILGLNVVETPTLRNLHNQINADLRQLFADPSAPFDGDAYRFHLTIEIGKIDTLDPTGVSQIGLDPYRAYFESLAEPRLGLEFVARQIGLFVSAGEDLSPYMLYKIIPLGGQSQPE